MDTLDNKLIHALKKNARASLSDLAIDLDVTRATVRARLQKLLDTGEIAGFTVLTKSDIATSPVRGLVMLEIQGTGANAIRQKLLLLPQVQAVHTTNGKWDMIVDLSTQSLSELDDNLAKIRKISGIVASETSLLLSTKYA